MVDELLGLETEARLGGRTWRLAPLRVADLAEIERRLGARPVGAKGGASAGPGGRRVRLAAIGRWLRTRAGSRFGLWLALRRNHPDLTEEDAGRLIVHVGSAPIHRGWIGEATSACPIELRHYQLRRLAWHRPVPWRELLADLGRAYGWTPREIAELTLAQLAVYVAALDRPPGPLLVSPAAARARRGRWSRRKGTVPFCVADAAKSGQSPAACGGRHAG